MKTKHISRRIRRFLRATKAVSALEYAILVGVVAIAVGGGLAMFGDNLSDTVEKIGADIQAGHQDKGKVTASP